MTGIAVVTTRLSSVTMTSATDVIANVQNVLAPSFSTILSSLEVVIAYSLQVRKKGESVLHQALDERRGPGLPAVEDAHRSHHVDQHSGGEELHRSLRPGALRLDQLDEASEAASHDRGDLGIVAGRVGLHLLAQPARVPG